MSQHGFGRARLDEMSTNPHVIRGREQIKIDELGGTSSNAINSINTTNPNMRTYIDAAAKDIYGSY